MAGAAAGGAGRADAAAGDGRPADPTPDANPGDDSPDAEGSPLDGNEPAKAVLDPSLATLTDDELTCGFDDALARSRGADWERLSYEAEIDARSMFRTDGVRSLRTWISMRTGEGQRSAGIHTFIAHRLPHLPLLSAALRDGLVSLDHVRCLTVLAELTETDDAELVELGQRHTVSQLETACRAARHARRRQYQEADEQRSLTWRVRDDGTIVIRARLSTIDGLTVTEYLTAVAEQAEPDPATGHYDPFDARCADALVDLCTSPAGSLGDRPNITLHLPVTLADHLNPVRGRGDGPSPTPTGGNSDDPGDPDDPGDMADLGDPDDPEDPDDLGDMADLGRFGVLWPPSTADGTVISIDTIRRLMCDSKLRITLEQLDGRAVGIGRSARTIPHWLNQQIRWRDRTCRFPGCEHTHWLHAHHIVHWADGGPTDLKNLTLLCGRHHRLVHELDWRLTGDPEGTLTFTGPSGQRHDTSPALHPHHLAGERACRHNARPQRPPPEARDAGP